MGLLAFTLLALATYRVVRLWLVDTITLPLRSRVIGDPAEPTRVPVLLGRPNRVNLWLYDLLTCQWCLGIHVAFWGTLAAQLSGWTDLTAVSFTVAFLAVAAAQSILHLVEGLLVAALERLEPGDEHADH